jgi:hypothetical protein
MQISYHTKNENEISDKKKNEHNNRSDREKALPEFVVQHVFNFLYNVKMTVSNL